MSLQARYYPPSGASTAQPVTLERSAAGELLIHHEQESFRHTLTYSSQSLDISERFQGGTRRILLPDDGVLEITESEALQKFLASLGRHDGLVTRLQQSWRAAAISVVVGIAACILGYLYGLPWMADRVAQSVPASWTRQLDSSILSQLQRDESFTPSQLPEARQAALREQFMALAQRHSSKVRDPIAPDIRFMRSGSMANAFALPGGTIVFLDGLVELAPSDAALQGVFAHEWAHVQYRHGLRNLARTTALALLAAWYLGDVSAIANAAVVLSQLQYSRHFETEADDVALKLMQAEQIDTRPMAELFRRMKQQKASFPDDEKTGSAENSAEKPAETSDSKRRRRLPDFLSTHPDIDQRIERFERGANPAATP